MLAATDIAFAYEQARPVLRAVSVSVRPGELTALIGPNGAGKSTLLRLLGGLAMPGSGGVTIDGQILAGLGPAQRAARVAFVPQRTDVAFAFTVREVVRLGLFAARANEDAEVARALKVMGLEERAGDPIGALSAGQQQRAALARVLAQCRVTHPEASGAGKYLLADEPVSAMDPAHAMRAMRRLADVAARGAGVVCVLHDVSVVLRFSARVVVLGADGRIVADGPTRDTLTPELLRDVYGIGFEALRARGQVVALLPAGEEELATD